MPLRSNHWLSKSIVHCVLARPHHCSLDVFRSNHFDKYYSANSPRGQKETAVCVWTLQHTEKLRLIFLPGKNECQSCTDYSSKTTSNMFDNSVRIYSKWSDGISLEQCDERCIDWVNWMVVRECFVRTGDQRSTSHRSIVHSRLARSLLCPRRWSHDCIRRESIVLAEGIRNRSAGYVRCAHVQCPVFDR